MDFTRALIAQMLLGIEAYDHIMLVMFCFSVIFSA